MKDEIKKKEVVYMKNYIFIAVAAAGAAQDYPLNIFFPMICVITVFYSTISIMKLWLQNNHDNLRILS